MKASELPGYGSNFLKAKDLQGSIVPVTIADYEIREQKKYGSDKMEKVLYITFEGKDKMFKVNKTNAMILESAFGDLDSWKGQNIKLTPGKTFSGQDTINVSVPDIQADEEEVDESELPF